MEILICPYCEAENTVSYHDIGEEYETDQFICCSCEKTFTYYFMIQRVFSTQKIVEIK
jgi:transposase-like protein